MFIQRIIISLFLLLFVWSCKTQNIFEQKQSKNSKDSLDASFVYDPNYQYTVRKDDKITISLWGQDELSVGSVYGIYNSNEVYGKWLMVDADGKIEIPKIGSLYVLGKNIPQLKDTLRKIFGKWIVNPVVDVKVLNKQITLLGELKNPGVQQVDRDHNNLLEMIGRAGGTEFYANIKFVKVLRQQGTDVRVVNVDLTKPDDFVNRNIALHPGDIVIVPSKKFKQFDKRVSTIIPFTTAISAAAILLSIF
jgi:polysaccharide biosynthesis/export protein